MKSRVRILNGMFDTFTLQETVTAVFAGLASKTSGWLCTVNVSTLMAMRRDPALQAFVERASIVVADGQPLVWCAPLFGGDLPERVTGIDLADALCQRAAAEGVGVYLLGSTPPLLDKALERLRSRHPALRIDGADGYFAAHSAESRADAVRTSGAAILLVGMGSPLQEAFIARHWDRLGVRMAIGVGGSFDVLAGARVRAHPWLQRAGLEWAVRLVQEPRRLLPRYLVTNTFFCLLIAEAVMVRLKHWIRTS
ncbi:MAG: WecB/TagA/CpsF family glycosyltransferase [Pseudomonadota bacterium]|nr:WecB/TagA/CpsF family glycosyltransferase [Pseudomonadota bacterium]